VPEENLLGKINGGWQVAMTALGYERSILTAGWHLVLIRFLRDLAEEAGRQLSPDRPTGSLFLERLGRAYASSRALSYLQYRYLSMWAEGTPPGAESSVIRLSWALAYQESTELAVDVLGPKAQIPYGEEALRDGEWLFQYFYARARSISSGTAEIQRNVIAERLLGLPRN